MSPPTLEAEKLRSHPSRDRLPGTLQGNVTGEGTGAKALCHRDTPRPENRDGLRILQVSTADLLGGAERIAANLHQAYLDAGHASSLAVGRKHGEAPGTFRINPSVGGGAWRRLWWGGHHRLASWPRRGKGWRFLLRAFKTVAEPGHLLDLLGGTEDFRFPGSWRLLEQAPARPDILHCHNLHGWYFDLRALARLSREVPTLLTLHDAWLLTGHCAHFIDCDRWKTGCGRCPDLTLYPALLRDGTARNHARKTEIYAGCRVHVATPCRWLMDRVIESILAPAVVTGRVIHNGVDLSIFRPADKAAARAALDIPPEADVLLFSALGVTQNQWKDYATMREAVGRLAARRRGGRLLFLALGEARPSCRLADAEIRFIPHEPDPRTVARYYQSADVYVHASRADTFPTSILEALACGTPVVATAVGGIPEQIRSIPLPGATGEAHADGEPNGALIPRGDAEAMSRAIARLLDEPALLLRLGRQAAADAGRRFDMKRAAATYLALYEEMLDGEPRRA